jgi:phospholipase C
LQLPESEIVQRAVGVEDESFDLFLVGFAIKEQIHVLEWQRQIPSDLVEGGEVTVIPARVRLIARQLIDQSIACFERMKLGNFGVIARWQGRVAAHDHKPVLHRLGADQGPPHAGLSVPEALANVEHIIVLCMENRSFDHFFGARLLVEGQTEVHGLTGDESNPDGLGNDIVVGKLDNYEPADPPHQWDEVHAQWNDGALDGFVTQQIAVHGESIKHEVMGYHTREDIPILYALADEYTLCDHWHCSLLGGTWPNRYYLHAATSNGRTSNAPALPLPTTIQDVLDDAGISNNNYYGDVPWKWGAFPIVGFAGTDSFDEFFTRIDDGTLEQVVIIDPSFTSNDDHPSHSIELGQALINTIYQALAQSQYWEKCLLIITYDEHGGFYDHVAPPLTPDATGPEFARQGFRVPALVIGPHVRKGCVVHEIFDHASFVATVTRKFGLPELNERAAGVNDLAVCIDPSKVDDPQPPAPLRKVVIDIDEVMARVGVESSQEELMRATGNWPITPEFTAAERARIRQLLAHGVRLGAVQLR